MATPLTPEEREALIAQIGELDTRAQTEEQTGTTFNRMLDEASAATSSKPKQKPRPQRQTSTRERKRKREDENPDPWNEVSRASFQSKMPVGGLAIPAKSFSRPVEGDYVDGSKLSPEAAWEAFRDVYQRFKDQPEMRAEALRPFGQLYYTNPEIRRHFNEREGEL